MTHRTTRPTAVDQPDLEKQVIEDIHFLQNAFSQSQELLDLGLRDEMAELFMEARVNPMTWLLRRLNGFSAELKELVAAWVMRFFRQRKDLLSKVFIVDSDGPELEYILVPIENNLATDYRLNDFVGAYEQTQFNRHVPVIFNIIPAELAGELIGVKPIEFA